MPDIFDDPLTPKNGLSLTPFHLITLLISSLSLFLSSLNLPPGLSAAVGMAKRASLLLVCLMIGHWIVTSQIDNYQKGVERAHREEKGRYDPLVKSKIDKKKNDWENPSAHPSHFLTTRDGKPRLFPFPLGLAGGGDSTKKTLWWEAGNSAHVGHHNQRETPEAREQLRLEVEGKEEKRLKKAKKAIEAYENSRKKWQKRLVHLKMISAIVIIGIFHRKIAVVCLAGLIYHIFAMEIANMLKPEHKEEDGPAKKRKKIPTTPGMAMTYLYETPDGHTVKPSGAIPTKAPSHRLMTSLDSRYAS
ncbi:uncharacterized protein I303_101580 [Kwoniella dejecticola CBS 10117]|uniref:Uncharacterized protein n=1 Tax=Kwoniella dejecticola CBS 10117 TaxID=1296121 RepID=A0A1A6ADE7_9TREE|nr:uncharacterized protein I303_02287 [Kwoniella dejecticola CBS 10117]OBR88068.1 hypothetical protein I303_02287 [Kwoniella dejecticola CBS 10117]